MHVNRKGGETEKFVERYIDKVVELGQNEDEADQEDQQDEPEVDLLLTPDEQAEQMVESFYNKFLINSEGSAASDNVDITWLLQAVPTKVLPLNIDQIRKFNFLTLQDAIIARENAEQVTSFEYYDRKNKQRVTTVKDLVITQMKNLFKIEENLVDVKEKLQKNEQLLKEYEDMQEEWAQDRQRIINEEVEREAERRQNPQGLPLQKAAKEPKSKGKGKKKKAGA